MEAGHVEQTTADSNGAKGRPKAKAASSKRKAAAKRAARTASASSITESGGQSENCSSPAESSARTAGSSSASKRKEAKGSKGKATKLAWWRSKAALKTKGSGRLKKSEISEEERKAQAEKREAELKRRIGDEGETSVTDCAVFASFPEAAAEEQAEFSAVLASFFAWMAAGKTPKSANGYMQQVRMLMRVHGRSLEAMASSDFLSKVKQTSENKKRNNIIGAGLAKFQSWLTERGSLTGPWEAKQSAGDSRFNLERCKNQKAAVQPVTGKGSLSALFGAKRQEPAGQTASSSSLAPPAPAPSAAEAPGAAPSGSVATPARAGSRPGTIFGAKQKTLQPRAKQKRGPLHSPAKKSEEPAKEPEQEASKQSTASPAPKSADMAKSTPQKVSCHSQAQQASSTSPEQQKELAVLRQEVNQAVKLRDFGEAQKRLAQLTSRCQEIGCAVPPPDFRAHGKEQPGSKQKAAADADGDKQDAEGEEPQDRYTFARELLKAKFPLMSPDDAAAEDDAEIIPAEGAMRAGRKGGKTTEEDEGAEDAEGEDEDEQERKKTQDMKKALASIPDASDEDIDRFPAVAATFKEWLKAKTASKGLREEEVEPAVQSLHDLFAQDEKALDGMAKAAYIKAVSQEPSHTRAMKLFAAFWAAKKGGPWVPPPPRAERGQEVRMRIKHFIPLAWKVRVVQRVRSEELVILTAPDGSKHFVEASKLANSPVLDSEDFLTERKRRQGMNEAEKQLELDRAIQKQKIAEGATEKAPRCAQQKIEVTAELAQSLNEMLAGNASEASRKEVYSSVLRQHTSCRGCGRQIGGRRRQDVDLPQDGSAVVERATWSSYDDVPDATQEEIDDYPKILFTFAKQGYPYVSGVKNLMELYKKKPLEMATSDFKRLVCADPENARCNGYLNSAVLYLKMFRESGGFDNLVDVDVSTLPLKYIPDFDRERNQEQDNFDDIQVDVPLELVMADATSKWQQELQEKLDEDGYILEDVDARGQRPVTLGISLLPNASDEEWELWPRILVKYEGFVKQTSEENTPMKRDAEANELFLNLKDLVEQHGKGPEAMASKKYVKMVRNTYSASCATSKKEHAATKFADFWSANKHADFPEPKVHAMSAMRYKLQDRHRVEQAKQIAADWQLPEGWSVKLGRDGQVLQVTGPGKSERFTTKEAALQAVAAKTKREAEDAKAQSQQRQQRVEASNTQSNLQQRLKDAVREENYELAERLQEELKGQEAPAGPTRKGQMPIVARDAEEVLAGKGGNRDKKRKAAPEDANPASNKARKAMSLNVKQKLDLLSCDLLLRAGEWRILGVRLGSGCIVPLGSKEVEKLAPDAAVIVFVKVHSEVLERKQKHIRKTWGLDDSWTVTVRQRHSGDRIIVRNADGKSFLSRAEVICEKDMEADQQLRVLGVAHAKELEELLMACSHGGQQLWKFEGNELTTNLSGLYTCAAGDQLSFSKVTCLGTTDGSIEVRRPRDGDLPGTKLDAIDWVFVDERGMTLAYTAKGASSDNPFQSKELHLLLLEDDQAASEQLTEVQGQVLAGDAARNHIQSVLAQAAGPCCGFCDQRGSRGRLQNSSVSSVSRCLSKAEKNLFYESKLLGLQERRALAPRTLVGMVECMLGKLKTELRTDTLPDAFLRKQVLRVGTMCSGTDAPVLVARALQRALSSTASQLSFEHAFSVEFDPNKQEFLKANFPECPYLFRDCTQMGRQRAFDVLSGKPQQIPGELDLLVAGFSCKDLSMMNSFRKTLQEMGQSGSTLKGVLDYAERYRPRIILLENVWAIHKANDCGFRQVDLVIEGLKARGYAAGYRLLNSCDYFIPQIRHRIWMWGIRIDEKAPSLRDVQELREQAEAATRSVEEKFNGILTALEEPCALHFDDYMLDDDHPTVRTHFKYMKSQERYAKTTKIRKSAKQDWLQKYDAHRAGHEYQYERPYTAVRDAEFVQVLTQRERELLDLKCLDVLNEQGKDPRTFPMLWELSQSVERVPGTRVRHDRQNYATCILPGMLWHSSRHRWVLGIEKLALQGIFAEDLKDTNFPQRLLGDLAGNAFTTSVCAVNLIAAITCADDLGHASLTRR
eukprot:TRINITY_DN8458_c0_g1_i2.p1 TRINITY_DN8458_c0_g1~~TRINITY_DN8458_c0_g1_i2.p1  ORF type:complete len:2069 (+),score=541.35 TRINITY_DN8458_c0_g1_i2:59-6265(+)